MPKGANRVQSALEIMNPCNLRPNFRTALIWLWITGVILGKSVSATTLVSGYVSGEWTLSKSPYVITADCTVLPNQNLLIEPGVTVFGAPEATLRVYGRFTAIGTPAQPILIRGASATKPWQGVDLRGTNETYRFAFCRFRDAIAGISGGIEGSNVMQRIEIANCDFTHLSTGIAAGVSQHGPSLLQLTLHNCVLEDIDFDGCLFQGTYFPWDLEAPVGNFDLDLTGNLFKRVLSAVRLNSCPPQVPTAVKPQFKFVNNTVAEAQLGIHPWGYPPHSLFDMLIKNNIFLRTSNALGVATSRTDASFNLFSGNQVDFVGFPTIYGIPILQNRNGDPCDVYNNIFLDPLVTDTTRYLLAARSPATDAGDPSLKDLCAEFRHGTDISDIGAYGGEFACGWLEHGFLPVIVSAPQGLASCVGQTAGFRVVAEGLGSLSYQWFFNRNSPLPGENQPGLLLSNLLPAQAGLYSVVISNSIGAVTSSPVALRISDACLGVQLYAGLSITGIVGRTYEIQTSPQPDGPAWTTVASPLFTEPRFLFMDTNTPFEPSRYYRVRLVP